MLISSFYRIQQSKVDDLLGHIDKLERGIASSESSGVWEWGEYRVLYAFMCSIGVNKPFYNLNQSKVKLSLGTLAKWLNDSDFVDRLH